MESVLSRLRSPDSVQRALDQFHELGRQSFLERYGFAKSRDYLVRNPLTGELCDSKAVVGAAFGFEFPKEGPLGPSDFSGGEATVVSVLQRLGFQTVRTGEDWSKAEVDATVRSYFEMLTLEARQETYKKTAFNEALRAELNGRSKASVELKHQNISAVLHALDLPFIQGYKPRGNSQLLLRQTVQDFVLANSELVKRVVDAMEEALQPRDKAFRANVVGPPALVDVIQADIPSKPARLPRKVDFARRDEANRTLGRSGEHWVLEYEQLRLTSEGRPDLFGRVCWVSDSLGDGAGYDILSYDTADEGQRFIEVKTTNGSHGAAFIVSRNELDFSKEAGDAFWLYRVFQFRAQPAVYFLQGDISNHVHLDALDYRASFRRLIA